MNTQLRLPNRKLKFSSWALVVGAGAFLFPLSLQKIDFRSMVSGGVSIAIKKSSPAYAALEDLTQEYSNPFEELQQSEPTLKLAAGQKFNHKAITVEHRVIAMQGLTIKAPTNLRPQPFLVGGLVAKNSPAANLTAQAEPTIYDSKGDLLPMVQRKKRLVDYYQAADLATPSARELAKDLIAEERQNAELNRQAVSYIPTQSGAPILIAKIDPKAPANYGRSSSSSKKGSLDLDLPIIKMPSLDKPSDDANPTGMMSFVDPDASREQPYWVTGQVEMTDGLAFIGAESSISIKRVYLGNDYEVGKIWVSEGRFEIRVSQFVGRLVAELKNNGKEVVGRGEIDLSNIDKVASRGDKVEGIKIPLRPTSDGTSVQVVSGYSSATQKIPVAQARVEIDSYTQEIKADTEGRVSDQSLVKESSFIVKAQNDKHMPTMAVATAGSEQEVRLYSKTMVKALVDLSLEASDRKEALRQSIVWGRVLMDGQVVSGARVELASQQASPVYFNQAYLPDQQINETSQNGMFAFLMVPEGVQSVRVLYKNKIYPAQVFPTENGVLSYVELQLTEKVNVQMRIYDLFDPRQNMAAHIRVIGLEESVPVQSGETISFPAGANPFVVEADAGENYELSRVVVNGTPDLVEVPVVKREWINQLAEKAGIQYIPQRGTIVGRIEDQAFEVELSGYLPQEKFEIVYFDAQGNSIEGTRGVAGGGFIIFNAPVGMQTLIVHPQLTKKAFSQVVVPEADFVHILNYNFSK